MVDHIARVEAERLAEEPYNADDKEAVNKARKAAGRREKAHLQVVRNIMLTEPGRAWMYDKLEACKIFGNPMTMGAMGVDTHATFFGLGEQNVGKLLLQDVQAAAPKEYLQMLEENKRPR